MSYLGIMLGAPRTSALMAASVVRLGTARLRGEGLRIGTVRRPPRGVPKAKFASGNWYDVWLPELSPSEATVKLGLIAAGDADWRKFACPA